MKPKPMPVPMHTIAMLTSSCEEWTRRATSMSVPIFALAVYVPLRQLAEKVLYGNKKED